MKTKSATTIMMGLVIGLCCHLTVTATCYYYGGCYAVEEVNCSSPPDPYQRFPCEGWEDVPGNYLGADGTTFKVHNVHTGVDQVICADYEDYYCSYWYYFECNEMPFAAEVRVYYDEIPVETGLPCFISR